MKLGVFATHPIQYQVPLWRLLNSYDEISLKVFYFSDHSVRGGIDKGFNLPVKWDIPLLEGYDYSFLRRNASINKPFSFFIKKIDELFENEKFDWILIQGYTYLFQLQLIKAAKKHKVKICFRGDLTTENIGNTFKEIVKNKYLAWFYSHINSFCYVGQNAYDHLKSKNIPDKKMFFSPFTVDNKFFENQKESFIKNQSRQKLKIENDSIVFLFSGKFIDIKNPKLISKVFKEINSQGNICLIMLGDGPLLNNVKLELTRIMRNGFILPGFVNQSELGLYFSAADVLILPSSSETWGLVVNEAMQFGLPVIVSDKVGCRRDLVVSGETGFIFKNNDPNDFKKYILKFMNNQELIKTMSEKAQMKISDYTIDKAVKGILEAIN